MNMKYHEIYEKVSNEHPIERLAIGRFNEDRKAYYKALVMYDPNESVKEIALSRLSDDEQSFFYDVAIDTHYPDELRLIAYNRITDKVLLNQVIAILSRKEAKVMVN